ncbi:unnamed protein product [Sphagnum troendelagicum]|uniref:Uncharacterized protein n=1 Tax=Sphagnum troendelagicum TaxID=128251 RepID=A0ABP0TIP1_9BRYO
MAICWSFASILALTLIALVAFRKPVFRRQGATIVVVNTRDPLESVAATTRTSVVLTLPLYQELPSTEVITPETNVSVEGSEQKLAITRQGRRKSRKLLESSRRARDSSLLEYHLPRRSVTVFETDRLVPTGPNPFHNSNTTEVWYP